MRFFDWCKKRKGFPSSFSYSYELTNDRGRWEWKKIPKKVLGVMKHAEKLKAYYGALDCGADGVEVSSNILNDCPQLKHFRSLRGIHNISSHSTANEVHIL